MQDWAYEIAEAEDIDLYLALFEEMKSNDDVRFVLADVIIQAFEKLRPSDYEDARWSKFLGDLRTDAELHAHQIWYWSSFDVSLDEAWYVSADFRQLSKELP